jgi:hypothetical protein
MVASAAMNKPVDRTRRNALAAELSAARLQAKQRAANFTMTVTVHVSLHACCTASGCRCAQGMHDINEVRYPGYQRGATTMAKPKSLYVDHALENKDTVFFPPFKGEHPIIITHIVLWNESKTKICRIRLSHALVLQPGDYATFSAGTILGLPQEHWEAA